MTIHFGTSGWRAIIADEFTFANLQKVSRAIAKYLHDHRLAARGIIVGHDTRFLSAEFARSCAQNLTRENIKVFLTNRDTPTPVIAFQILHKKTAGAVNITASHNPAHYNGIKFSPAYGGPAPTAVTNEIERNIRLKSFAVPHKKNKIQLFDPRPAYLARIKQLVDLAAIRRAQLKIGVELLYGSGRGYLDRLLQEAACRLSILHEKPNPLFGGLPPEPARLQLKQLTALIKKQRLHLGLAIDGDGDRFGVVDRDGVYLNANQVISLLTAHLLRTRPRQRRLARTVVTTHMLDALAGRAGLEVVETLVGFKYIGQELAKGDCLLGAEESGGLSIVGHVPEKDGILTCLLLAELVAVRKQSLAEFLKELYREVGPFFSARDDFRFAAKNKQNLIYKIRALRRGKYFLNERIAEFKDGGGYKFIFTDGSWLMFRLSGTEPVIRCYAEAKSKTKLKALQNLARKVAKV